MPGGERGVVLTLCGVQFVDVMGVTIVVTALPRMVADLGGGNAGATAVVTAYATVFGGLLMVASRIGDRHGHRRVLLFSLAGFTVSSALAGLAGSIAVLTIARALQGAAAAASVPAALRLMTTIVPEGPRRRRAVAAWSAAGAAAGGSGFVVGGVLTELVSWRAVFVVSVVLGVALTAVTAARVPASPASDADRPVVPWRPGLALTVAIGALVVGATLVGARGSVTVGVAALVLAGAAGACFVTLERRGSVPLVPVAAGRATTVRWGAAVSFAITATTSSSLTLAMLYLQDELGLSPLRAAGLLLTLSVLVVVAATFAPRLIGLAGWSRTMAAGLAAIACGNLLLRVVPSAPGIAAASAACGVGIGLASVAATDMGTTVSTGAKSAAAALLNTSAQTGTAIGTAGALLLATLTDTATTWLTLCVAAGCAALVVLARAPGPPRQGAT
jgi:MFS family permease